MGVLQYCTFGLEAADDAQNVRVLGRHLAEMITTNKIHQNEKNARRRRKHRAGCSKAEPKISPRRRPFPGVAGRPKFNQLEMVTTFTYIPSLVKIDARNFELSW